MSDKYFNDDFESPRIKMAVFAGASEALKKKKVNYKMSDEEIIQYISDNVDKIISNID